MIIQIGSVKSPGYFSEVKSNARDNEHQLCACNTHRNAPKVLVTLETWLRRDSLMLLLRFIVTWWKPYVLKIRQARIQEFSSGGGVQLFENFWQAKKKKKKKKEERKQGLDCSFILSLLQKYGLNRLSRKLFTFKFIFDRGWSFCNWEPLYTTTHIT